MERVMSQLPLLRRPAVYARYPLGRTQLYANIQRGLFVKPIRLSERAVAWPAHEVDALCAARIAGKSDDEIRALVSQLEASRMVPP